LSDGFRARPTGDSWKSSIEILPFVLQRNREVDSMTRRKTANQRFRRHRVAGSSGSRTGRTRLWITALGVLLVAVAGLIWQGRDRAASRQAGFKSPKTIVNPTTATGSVAVEQRAAPPADASPPANAAPLPTLEINSAVMVTVELDFGGAMPGIADALRDVERRHRPDDGAGRTFAILDAYGGPTPDGRKLHLSMHVSAEKPGIGTLVFRRTGEVLWQNRIVATTNQPSFTGKNLMIYIDVGDNRMLTVDGSANPATLLDANIKEAGIPLRDLWTDGDSREVIFIYSACGCPVKVMCRRGGDRLVRTSETPVIFPDDPAVVAVINRLMQW
jgi:hypothetical protein